MYVVELRKQAELLSGKYGFSIIEQESLPLKNHLIGSSGKALVKCYNIYFHVQKDYILGIMKLSK